jgi:hypothetical protein
MWCGLWSPQPHGHTTSRGMGTADGASALLLLVCSQSSIMHPTACTLQYIGLGVVTLALPTPSWVPHTSDAFKLFWPLLAVIALPSFRHNLTNPVIDIHSIPYRNQVDIASEQPHDAPPHRYAIRNCLLTASATSCRSFLPIQVPAGECKSITVTVGYCWSGCPITSGNSIACWNRLCITAVGGPEGPSITGLLLYYC